MLNKIASISQRRPAFPTQFRQATQRIRRYLQPPACCILCHQSNVNAQILCDACYPLLPELGPACNYCAIPLVDGGEGLCGMCCQKKPDLDRVITAYRFEEPLRSWLHAFKYHEQLYLSSLLTDLMLRASHDPTTIECFIPIPMHTKRLRKRGFNQAAMLAIHLSQHLRRPCELYQCNKIINTMPQAGLNASLRKTNLKNAFTANTLPYQQVTLIDDLYTTGSTANELARTLKRQGVKRVELWCCARAVPHFKV